MDRYNNILDTAAPDLNDDRPILIAIMGMIGSGKSSFIQAITGISDIAIREGLQPGEPPPRVDDRRD